MAHDCLPVVDCVNHLVFLVIFVFYSVRAAVITTVHHIHCNFDRNRKYTFAFLKKLNKLKITTQTFRKGSRYL